MVLDAPISALDPLFVCLRSSSIALIPDIFPEPIHYFDALPC